MLAFAGRRLIAFVLTLMAAALVIFLMLEVLPGDPAAVTLGLNAAPEALAALRTEMGLTDLPVIAAWIGDANDDVAESAVTALLEAYRYLDPKEQIWTILAALGEPEKALLKKKIEHPTEPVVAAARAAQDATREQATRNADEDLRSQRCCFQGRRPRAPSAPG